MSLIVEKSNLSKEEEIETKIIQKINETRCRNHRYRRDLDIDQSLVARYRRYQNVDQRHPRE